MNPDYGMTPVSASAGIGLQDDHGHPGFAKPYKYNTVSSDQMYQFQCPYYNSNQWVPDVAVGRYIADNQSR